jgi:uncharacterized membrane protein
LSPALAIALLWLGFGGSHILLSSRGLRPRLVSALGQPAFLGLYSLVAFAFFVPLVWIYSENKHAGAALWGVGAEGLSRWALHLAMAVAFVLLGCSLVRPSPAAVVPGDPTPRGVARITRHPQNMAIAIFGLLHCIANGFASDLAFFGGAAAFALIGSWHQDQRKLADGPPGFAEFHAQTPFLPFSGPGTLQGLRELPIAGVVIGLTLFAVVRWFHSSWFGGAP